MVVRKVDADRFKIQIENVENGKRMWVQRYPTSQNYAKYQVEVYQNYLKGLRKGEEVELPDAAINYSFKKLL